MKRYIKEIKINNLYHLHGFSIKVEDEQHPHILITGKNGSGKTVLLTAVCEYIQSLFLPKDEIFTSDTSKIELHGDLPLCSLFEQLSEEKQIEHDNFILAFYLANRKVDMEEVKNIKKTELPDVKQMKESSTKQFLYFLSNLKVQEALAKSEGNDADAENIKAWFNDFEKLLQRIFEDENLTLQFNYRNYNFKIHSEGKEFTFNELSDGFAAILDIVADLILRMQTGDSPIREYEKPGVVLIDEIETHLHLELQKHILPMLVQVFPNIQFIVTTHSPFVLNSLESATVFDLEHREPVADLSQYSYDALAEGYFGVNMESNRMTLQLNSFEELLKKEQPTASDTARLRFLLEDFRRIPEPAAPQAIGRFLQLCTKYHDKLAVL